MILSTTQRGDIWYTAVTDENGGLVACSFSHNKKAAEKSVMQSLPEGRRRNLRRSNGEAGVIEALHGIHEGMNVDRPRNIILMTRSKFHRAVYETAMKIPKGKVTTYRNLARLVGSRRASRAVGNAMARNPLPLVVPCHRVVRSTLLVGNYGSERNGRSRTKRELLVHEGVQFDGERISQRCLWDRS